VTVANLSAALAGALFAIGLTLSGMTEPGKVLAFLDVTGSWDPSLALVMAGAIAVYAPFYRVVMRTAVPLYAREFVVASDTRLDARLVVGAALFGAGWGLAGYCPGPALAALGAVPHGAGMQPVIFVVCMVAGMFAHRLFEEWRVRVATDKRVASQA
jgi:hypothetical protein